MSIHKTHDTWEDIEQIMSEAELDKLLERLEGKVRVPITDGLGFVEGSDEPNNPNEFVRWFPTSPVAKDAVTAFRQLRANLALKGLEVERLSSNNASLLKIAKEVQSALGRLAQQGVTGGAFATISREINVAIAAVEEK